MVDKQVPEIVLLKKHFGEYTIFIDSDDFLEPQMTKEMYEKAIENNSDIVICDYYEVYNDKKIEKKAIKNYSTNSNINYILSNPSPWNKLIKTDILKKNSIMFLENHIYEDLATMPILAGFAKNISYVQKPLYNYVIRNGSTMRQSTYNKKLDSIFVAISHLKNEFIKRNLFRQYSQEIEFLTIYHLLYAASGRFLEYKEGKPKLKEIKNIIKIDYPNWKRNLYYKKQNLVFKTTCNIFYYQNPIILNLYNIVRNLKK